MRTDPNANYKYDTKDLASMEAEDSIIDLDEEESVRQALHRTFDATEKRPKTAPKKPAAQARPKRKNPLTPITIILGLTTLCSLLLCFVILYIMNQKTEAVLSSQVSDAEDIQKTAIYYDQNQVNEMLAQAKQTGANEQALELKNYIRSVAETPNPNFSEMLRKLYPENIVYLDSEGYHFIPISEAYPASNVSPDNLIKDSNGLYDYMIEGEIVSKRGIDVSQHQGEIDWQQVADAGIDFAILRMGFRGYGSGALVEDEQFQANLEGATSAGLEVGVYFFTQAITEEEALEEADMVLAAIANANITGPIVLDVERPDDSSARGNQISKDLRTRLTKVFCQRVEEAGYRPMIYGNLYTLFSMLELSQIAEYDIWFAFYNDYVYYPYEITMWQYTDKGQIPGVSGNVDLNILFEPW